MPQENKSLAEIRSDVCNATLWWIFALALFSGGASLSRVFENGWQPVMYISVALVSAAGGITLFRHHIPFAIRAAFVVFLYFAGGIVGHLLYGSPYALTFFVASGIMAAVFFGEKIGLVTMGLCIASSLSIYFVFDIGLLPKPSPPDFNFTQWLTNASRIAVASIGPLIAITRLRQFLVARSRAAEAASQSKSDFLAMMSHELRTPLTAILGISDILLSEKLSPDHHQKVSRVSRAGTHLLDLLNDILDFSKIEAGRVTVERVPFNPYQLTTDIRDLMEPLASQKNIALKFDVSTDLDTMLIGDPTHIKRVLHNIVGNAIKFTEHGKVAVRASMRTEQDGRPTLFFQVADTGIGMSSEQQQNLFKPFTQADEGITRRFGGTGLGLSISHNLVELMGGEITVSSNLGQGSTFAFTAPVFEDRTSSIIKSKGRNLPDQTDHPRLKILVADDNEATRFLLKSMLTKWGHSVFAVENGALALEAVQKDGYDVVLMDMQMPIMDGATASRAIRDLDTSSRNIPIIALTADIVSENRAKYEKSGITSLIGKPVNWAELADKLKRHAPAENETGSAVEMAGASKGAARPDVLDEKSLVELEGLVGRDALIIILETAGENILQYREAMTNAFETGHFGDAKGAAHALKGLCSQFGAVGVTELSGRIMTSQSLTELMPIRDDILDAIDTTKENILEYAQNLKETG